MKKIFIFVLLWSVIWGLCRSCPEALEIKYPHALPKGVSNPVVIKHNRYVYVIGGNTRIAQNTYSSIKDVYRWDWEKGQWQESPPMLTERTTAGGFYYNERIYIFGGMDKDNQPLNTVESMDINTGEWKTEPPMPTPMSRFALTRRGEKAYFFGGIPDQTSVWELDVLTWTFTKKNPLPQGLNRLSSITTDDDTIYIVGGEDPQGNGVSQTLIYDPVKDCFLELPPMKHPRKNFSISTIKNYVIVSGGWIVKEGKNIFLDSTEIFDPQTLKWTEGTPLKIARDGNRSVILGDKMLVVGGYGGDFVSEIESIALDKNISIGWKTDQELKFHLCYLPDEYIQGDENPPSLNFTPRHTPDITNIMLSGLIGLQFPVPPKENPDKYKFYLKFFQFPSSFPVQKTVLPIADQYLLNRLTEWETLQPFLSSQENVVIKMGYIGDNEEIFSPTSPFPPLSIKKGEEEQQKFNKNIIFSSLYVLPDSSPAPFKDDNKEALWSAQGVLSMHNRLLQNYRDHLTETRGEEEDKYYYFLRQEEDSTLSVIRLPKKPMVFDNWQDLPMPQNPRKIFLTGLLLIYRDTYTPDGEKKSSTLLEVGSVMRLP